MKIIDQLKKVNLIQFVPAIFVISLVGNSVFGYTAPKSEKSKNNSENQVEAATTQAKKQTKKANAGGSASLSDSFSYPPPGQITTAAFGACFGW